MAYSILTYTGDGSTTDFLFDKPYIAQSDVVAYVDDVLTAITYPDATHVRFSPAPANGTDIEVKRVTNVAAATYLFPDPTYFKSENLDGDFTQQLYLHQEVLDALEQIAIDSGAGVYVEKDGDTMTGTLSMGDGTSRSRLRFDEGNYGTQLIFRNNSSVPIAQFHRETGYEDHLQLQTFNASTSAQETTVEFGQGQIALSGTLAADPTHDNHLTRESYVKKHLLLDGSRNMTGDLTLAKNNPNLYLDAQTAGETSQVTFRDEANSQRMNLRYDDSNEIGALILRNAAQGIINQFQLNTDGNVSVLSAAAPTAASHLTRKDYVDTKLPLVGGTLAGRLTINYANPLQVFQPTTGGTNILFRDSTLSGINRGLISVGAAGGLSFTQNSVAGALETAVAMTTNGNVTVNGVAPTAANHLTRKDYVDGTRTMTGDLTISNANPQLVLVETGATVDEGRWDILADVDEFNLRAVNDANSSAYSAISITRTGITIDETKLRKPIAVEAAPLLAAHLTRKDYVDSKTHSNNLAAGGTVLTGTDAGSWTVASSATGLYTMTHNLGHTNYGVTGNCIHQTLARVVTVAKFVNSVQFWVWDLTGTAVAGSVETTLTEW